MTRTTNEPAEDVNIKRLQCGCVFEVDEAQRRLRRIITAVCEHHRQIEAYIAERWPHEGDTVDA